MRLEQTRLLWKRKAGQDPAERSSKQLVGFSTESEFAQVSSTILFLGKHNQINEEVKNNENSYCL
ncbi:hypothetical protein [Bacillus alkalicola]|uniref:Uncharacterized protein n=1 Tax=Evansella alkalicola TaxID=745819 RepID=A0ABS6JYK5_9BACI|nr:hypothetical protein [Bacillus alkalicola]MBU9723684.1 hypothetical protein [Bacillus alkalicola]